MQLRYKFELRCQLDRLRHSLDSAKILFRIGVGWLGGWVGGKIIPRIRLTSAKDLVEVEAELGNYEPCNGACGKDIGFVSVSRPLCLANTFNKSDMS